MFSIRTNNSQAEPSFTRRSSSECLNQGIDEGKKNQTRYANQSRIAFKPIKGRLTPHGLIEKDQQNRKQQCEWHNHINDFGNQSQAKWCCGVIMFHLNDCWTWMQIPGDDASTRCHQKEKQLRPRGTRFSVATNPPQHYLLPRIRDIPQWTFDKSLALSSSVGLKVFWAKTWNKLL